MGTDASVISHDTDDRRRGGSAGVSAHGGVARDVSVLDAPALRAEVATFLDAVTVLLERPVCWDSTRWDIWWGVDALEWRVGDPDHLSRNVRVWRDSRGVIVAVAIHERPGRRFDVVVHPAWVDVAEPVVSDALSAWGEAGAARTQVVVGDVHEEALRRLGFRPVETGVGMIHEFATTPLRRVVLPPGYTVRDILHTGGRRARLVCMAEAFLGEGWVPKDAAYPRADLPGYLPELDLAVIAPHGLDVVTCFGFVPGSGAPAVIEGVGTRPGSRGLGLATAAVAECLDLLAERGVPRATATGWHAEANAMYRGLLPTRSHRIDSWVREPA
ncbi:MAG TPA: GNAT family N-acetyltransferase [Cellulomonas sp.]|uniref:GNAT family N-acetyltransferase n=1 Tax=Cellulomonas sp. TaxID=40001 RepID=UPI002E32D4AF|nr:GNAT family N-acetyltransferase [Cellulomonas sp.]HEX5333338.1 GNAT family N-acetyltransferase [Cellulomonas sp.]